MYVYMIHPSLCVWHWGSLNLSLCELRLVQIARKQYDLMILAVTWIIFRDGIATLLCTFPYSNPGPNPLTLKPPCALRIDTKTASNGQREKQAFHSLSNNKKSTNKKQQHQLFFQQTKNPPKSIKTTYPTTKKSSKHPKNSSFEQTSSMVQPTFATQNLPWYKVSTPNLDLAPWELQVQLLERSEVKESHPGWGGRLLDVV